MKAMDRDRWSNILKQAAAQKGVVVEITYYF